MVTVVDRAAPFGQFLKECLSERLCYDKRCVKIMGINCISEDQNQIRQQIKETARLLFNNRGYDVIELRDIAFAVNVSEDIITSIFLSKDELLEAVWSEWPYIKKSKTWWKANDYGWLFFLAPLKYIAKIATSNLAAFPSSYNNAFSWKGDISDWL